MDDIEQRDPLNEIPNSLTFSQAQVNFILGRSIASIYRDLLNEPMPPHLQELIDQLEPESEPPTDFD